MAQWKRAGPITQRSVDRNHALLSYLYFLETLNTVIQLLVYCVGWALRFRPRIGSSLLGIPKFLQLPSSLRRVKFTETSEDVCPLLGLIPKAKHIERRPHYDFHIFSFVPPMLCNQQRRHRNVHIVPGFTHSIQTNSGTREEAVLVVLCAASGPGNETR